jgi:hypothetical protein
MRALLVSPVGIEPTTNWLKASCSTTELRARAEAVRLRSVLSVVNRAVERWAWS